MVMKRKKEKYQELFVHEASVTTPQGKLPNCMMNVKKNPYFN